MDGKPRGEYNRRCGNVVLSLLKRAYYTDNPAQRSRAIFYMTLHMHIEFDKNRLSHLNFWNIWAVCKALSRKRAS